MMPITHGIRALIHQNVDSGKLLAAARKEGMRTLRESGVEKISQGQTTIAEVLRVTMRDAF
jgi:type II secretory ATPase GspE/PulE/Tfp pilus assembly ATPase PilB-like protein